MATSAKRKKAHQYLDTADDKVVDVVYRVLLLFEKKRKLRSSTLTDAKK